MAIRVLALGVAGMLAAAAPLFAQLVEDYRFRGSVVDTKGKPLAKVQFRFRELRSGQRITFETGADGSFDRRMIPHGVYEVAIEKPGYLTQRLSYDWSASAPVTIEKEARVTLESEEDRSKAELERARVELGKKTAGLYQESFDAMRAGRCPEAEAKANEMLSLGAGNFEYAVRFILGRCRASAGELDAAISEYRKSIALKADLFEAHFDLAGIYAKKGLQDEAMGTYAHAAALRPDDPEVHYNQGALLFRAGKYDAALPELERCLELAPGHVQAAKAAGYAWLSAEKKDMKKAVERLTSYLELAGDASDAAQVRQILKELGGAGK